MRWTVRAAGAVTAAFFIVAFFVLDPIGQAIAVGGIAACMGALIAVAIQQRAEYDDAAPASLRGWALDPEEDGDEGFTPLPAPRPARVLRVMRTAPLALPGPTPLLAATDADYADWLALYAAWTGPEAEVDAATQAEIAAWEWDDPGEW